MAGKVLKFTNGFPGTVTRSIDDIVETLASGEASNPILFGAPVALDDGKVVNVAASKTNIIGIAMRSIKTENTYGGNDPKYNAGELVDQARHRRRAGLQRHSRRWRHRPHREGDWRDPDHPGFHQHG